jgi:hypothetical protein
MLPLGPAPKHLALASSSASGGSCSGSDPCAGLYIRTTKLIRGILVMTSILRPLARASSSSSSASTPDLNSSDDYIEIRTSACGEPAEGDRLILMVALNGDQLRNSSSRYPTIERSEAFDARSLSGGLVWNLNLNFSTIQLQAIMKTIRRITPNGCPLATLAQQGAEVANIVITEKLAGVP